VVISNLFDELTVM